MSGSLRIFAVKKNQIFFNSIGLKKKQKIDNLNNIKNFKKKLDFIKREMNNFVLKHTSKNKIVVGLGAATKKEIHY